MALNQPLSSYPQGTHTSDGPRAGRQFPSFYTKAPGAPVSPMFIYDFIPKPASLTNIAASQVAPNGSLLTLVNSSTSGTNTIVTLDSGESAVKFDSPRAIQVTGVAGTTATTLSVYGLRNNIRVTEQITGPVGATTVKGLKTYDYVLRIWSSASSTNAISVGCADVFGLPYVAYNSNYIQPYWKGRQDYNVTYPTLKGSVALVAGTATVATANVKSNSLIYVVRSASAGTAGELAVPVASIINGTSFTINSYAANGTTLAADTSTVSWYILEPSYFSGTATLGTGGTVTVSTLNVKSDSIILISRNTTAGTAIATLDTGAIVDGETFIIDSSNINDRSTVNWWILSPSLYAGTATLVPAGPPSTVTVTNSFVTAASTIIASRKTTTGATAGTLFIGTGSIVANTSFVISSSSATDNSVINYVVINAPTAGVFNLPDRTDPAIITGGDTKGTYIPSTPSDGASSLTIFMYNRAIDNTAYLKGIETGNPYLAQTDANLYGVLQYSNTTH